VRRLAPLATGETGPVPVARPSPPAPDEPGHTTDGDHAMINSLTVERGPKVVPHE
jgi:hypothetical protein